MTDTAEQAPRFHWTAKNFQPQRTAFKDAMADATTPYREQRMRYWLARVLDPESEYTRLYRTYGEDLDEDLKWAAELCSGSEPLFSRYKENHYWQRLIWRALMRNYAWCHAWRVGGLMAGYEHRKADAHWKANALWKLLRGISYLYPKLILAVAIGLLAILGSTGLDSVRAGLAASWPWTLALMAGAGFLCFSEVARRVGRRPGAVFCRSLFLFMLGLAYAALFAWLKYGNLDGAALLLLLAFVTQLFWHDRPVSEPL